MPHHTGSVKLGQSQGQLERALRCPKVPSAGDVTLEATAGVGTDDAGKVALSCPFLAHIQMMLSRSPGVLAHSRHGGLSQIPALMGELQLHPPGGGNKAAC